ncbi:MAG: hypothetical protein JXX29_00565 [Deltaproteobacteria bacterium]|nr:hypothetical protein [Deltaproteobacteria bacterium]MBN2670129.1 hypothetical protein [Deltaproteobacteria bacterium]
MPHSMQLFEEAVQAMKAHDYSSAISLFEQKRQQMPEDLNTLLHLGICHLLNHSETAFLTIHEEAKKLRSRLAHIPEHVAEVFAQYEGLVRKVTATAVLVGTVTGAACGICSGHNHSDEGTQENDEKPAVEESAQSTEAPDTSASSNTDSAAIEPSAPNSDSASTDNAAAPKPDPEENAAPAAVKPAHSGNPVSAHKYSGGVYLKPKKADDLQTVSSHRYSGGVFLKSRE